MKKIENFTIRELEDTKGKLSYELMLFFAVSFFLALIIMTLIGWIKYILEIPEGNWLFPLFFITIINYLVCSSWNIINIVKINKILKDRKLNDK